MWGYQTPDGHIVYLGYDETAARAICQQVGATLARVQLPRVRMRAKQAIKEAYAYQKTIRKFMKRQYKNLKG